MSVQTSDNLEDLFLDPSPEIWDVLLDYYQLASSIGLSQKGEERLSQILERACSSEIMTFWIGEIDYLIGQKSGLFTPKDCHSYYNQQVRLKEYLTNLEFHCDRTSNCVRRQPTETKK